MTEGTKTYEGLSVPLFGESEIQQQTVATDILTLTGGASQTGDFVVMQNSDGTELVVFSASGLMTAVGVTLTGVLGATLSSTAANSIQLSITSTGAIADGAITNNAVLVSASSKSVLNAIVGYNSGGGSEVGSCNYFLAVHGSKAPSYLFGVGATAAGVAAAADNGFFNASMTWTAFPTSAIAIAGIRFLAGSKAYYIPAWPDTTFNA